MIIVIKIINGDIEDNVLLNSMEAFNEGNVQNEVSGQQLSIHSRSGVKAH
jgi:hypothetical protein